LLVIVAGGGYWGVTWCWKTVEKWLEPKYITVQSQTEAMGKLQNLLAKVQGDDKALADSVATLETDIAWMESEEAKETARWFMTSELDRRGLWQLAVPREMDAAKRHLALLPSLQGEERTKLLTQVHHFAQKLEAIGHENDALEMYRELLDVVDPSDTAILVPVLRTAVELEERKGNDRGMLSLIQRIHDRDLSSQLVLPEDVRTMAKLLLKENDSSRRLDGHGTSKSLQKVRSLLENAQLTSCPEWGALLLSELSDRIADITTEQIPATIHTLETALGCFRASGDEMKFAPETMLALAKLNVTLGDMEKARLWLDRTEGAAMTLGVDQPRILPGGSIKEDVKAVQEGCEKRLQEIARLTELQKSLRDGDAYLKAEQWDQVLLVAPRTMQMAKAIGVFTDGYLPAAQAQVAKAYEGQKKWESASDAYEKIIRLYDQLSSDDQKSLEANLKSIGSPEFYKAIHQNLANCYRKQDRITKSKEILQKIQGDQTQAR
jgi:tetratricopeptide (TPR) repeat protein